MYRTRGGGAGRKRGMAQIASIVWEPVNQPTDSMTGYPRPASRHHKAPAYRSIAQVLTQPTLAILSMLLDYTFAVAAMAARVRHCRIRRRNEQ